MSTATLVQVSHFYLFHSNVYNSDGDRFHVSKPAIGSCVAVYGDGKWQRADVVVINENDAFVVFFDTGLKHYVKLKNIRHLVSPFNKISRKCCKGSLFGVQPKDGQKLWNTEAILWFMENSLGKRLHATVKGQNGDNFIVSLSGGSFDGKQLSESLLLQGFADQDLGIPDVINASLVS